MKLIANLLLCVFLTSAQANPIKRFELNFLTTVKLPVSRDNLTTIQFPSPVSDVEGAFVSTTADPPAKFQLSFRPGSHFLSLRALNEGVSATIHVAWKGKIYVFQLTESADPVFSAVMFERTPLLDLSPFSAGANTTARLREIVRVAKLYPSIQSTNPELVKQIQRLPVNKTVTHGQFDSTIEEIFRFDADDTLVFHLSFTNRTSSPILYLPNTLSVKLGPRRLMNSFVEADGVIGTNAKSSGFFAVTGGINGTPENLALTNAFEIAFETIPIATQPQVVTPATQPTIAPVQKRFSVVTRPSNFSGVQRPVPAAQWHPVVAVPPPAPPTQIVYQEVYYEPDPWWHPSRWWPWY
jgi:hypothetical protein